MQSCVRACDIQAELFETNLCVWGWGFGAKMTLQLSLAQHCCLSRVPAVLIRCRSLCCKSQCIFLKWRCYKKIPVSLLMKKNCAFSNNDHRVTGCFGEPYEKKRTFRHADLPLALMHSPHHRDALEPGWTRPGLWRTGDDCICQFTALY